MASSQGRKRSNSSEKYILKQGYLQKKEHGKLTRKENDPKKMKFQQRYCILTRKCFIYKEDMQEKTEKSFSVKRIKFVENVDSDTFQNCQCSTSKLDFSLCFQFGDEEKVVHVVAPNYNDKKEWVDALRNVATKSGNQMMTYYHPGVYYSHGSHHSEQWSCCNGTTKKQKGCKACHAYSTPAEPSASPVTKQTIADVNGCSHDSRRHSSTSSVETVGGESLTSSSSCYSIPEMKGQTQMSFENSISKLEVDSSHKLSIWRQSTATVDSGVYSDGSRPVSMYTTNSSRPVSVYTTNSECATNGVHDISLESHLDEGIEFDVHLVHDNGIGIHPSSMVPPAKHDSLLNQEVTPKREKLTLHQSFKLSSCSTVTLGCRDLIAGTNEGMVWCVSQDCTERISCIKVAGQIASLSTWGDYVAIGSAVVQLVKTSDKQPKRIIYRKAKDRLMAHGRKNFVSFIGKKGKLAAANSELHGNSWTIDIWPPPTDEQVVMKPETCIPMNGKVLSLSSSSTSESILSVLVEKDKKLELQVIDITKNNHPLHSVFVEGDNIDSLSVSQLDERNIAVAVGNHLRMYDTIGGLHLKWHTKFESDISCVNRFNDDHFGVGFYSGEFICIDTQKNSTLYDCTYDINGSQILSNSPIVSLVLLKNKGVCVAHKDGVLQLWKGSTDHESDVVGKKEVRQKSTLGLELHNRGIFSMPEVIASHTDEQEIGHGAYITLPQEVVDENIQVERALRPCGTDQVSFRLPDKMFPISQAVWLCTTPEKQFKQPAKLRLIHCFQNDNEENKKLITFLKADHKDITRENGEIVIKFKATNEDQGTQSEFPANTTYGILRDHHFCVYCLFAYGEECEILGKMRYYLSILKPTAYSKHKTAKIYCILSFDLPDCKKLIEEQIAKVRKGTRSIDYSEVIERTFQFETSRYESALEMQIYSNDAVCRGWIITVQSERKIYAEDVNFFNYRNTECLDKACRESQMDRHYPYTYPPRFILEVSSKYARGHSKITLTFTGAKQELSTEIQLDILREETDLQPQELDDRIQLDRPYKHFNGLIEPVDQ